MGRTVLVCLLLSIVPASVIFYGYKNSKDARYRVSQIGDNQSIGGSVVPLRTEQSVDLLQFTSSNVGWLGSHSGELYRTMDGGNTWESINLGVTGFLAEMQFVSDHVGWVIMDQYIEGAGKTEGTYGKLLHTEDAGKTWTTRLDLKGAELVDLSVVNGSEVWLVGSKFSSSEQIIHSKFLLLQGKKSGAEWIDRSDQLNKFSMSIDGRVYESPVALFALAPHTLVLLTRHAVILRSSDEGENWSRIASLDTRGLPAHKLAAYTTFPLILAGMGSAHGTASLLMRPANDGTFTTTQLGGTYLKDVLYLPDRGILAGGTRLVETDPPQDRREGVILFSADLGRNWITMHRATHVKSINSLALNGHTIWAGGSSGYLVKLTDNNLPTGEPPD
jgi:photosystem II stability/assembly factor-like uncharacterized protein